MSGIDVVRLRPYNDGDLATVIRFVGECYLRSHGCGCLHPGDIAHTMSNKLEGRDLDQHFWLYERAKKVQALLVLFPARDASYSVILPPEEYGGALERALRVEGLRRALALLRSAPQGGHERTIRVECMACDSARQALLAALGYTPESEPFGYMDTRPLDVDLPAPALLDGYTIRSVAGEHEAERVAAAHNGAFGADWIPEAYLAAMRTPAFVIEHELVAVAPDGAFAAFAIYWPDPVSGTGLFEPVGTAPAFQRRGLGTALLYEGMRRMRAAGMRAALIGYDADNAPAEALYRSVGFQRQGVYTWYHAPDIRQDATATSTA